MDSHPSVEGVRNLIEGHVSARDVIQAGRIEHLVIEARPEAHTALDGLPAPGRVFVGREPELGRLAELLGPEGPATASRAAPEPEGGAATGPEPEAETATGPGPEGGAAATPGPEAETATGPGPEAGASPSGAAPAPEAPGAFERLAARHGLEPWTPPAPAPGEPGPIWRMSRPDGSWGPVPDNLRMLARPSPSGQLLPLPYALLEDPADQAPPAGGRPDDAAPPESGPASVVLITGPGGAGKTELALQAARLSRTQGAFPGGALFVGLAGYRPDRRVEPVRALGVLLEALGVPAAEQPAGQPEREQLYRSLLAARDGAVLVVLDDAASLPQVLPLLPGHPDARVLVTSRHRLTLPGAEVVELSGLAGPAALAALRLHARAAGRSERRFEREPEAAAALTGLCEGLPLALRMVGALLAADRRLPLGELAEELGDRRTALDGIADEEQTLRAVIDLSYRHLPPDQARLLRLLALAPFPVATDVASALDDAAERTTVRRLRGLARAHLVTGGGGRDGRWELPGLIRLFLDGLGPEAPAGEREDALIRLLLVYQGRAREAVADLHATTPRDGRSVAVRRAQGLGWLDTVLPEALALLGTDAPADLRVVLCYHLERYLDRRHLPGTALTVAYAALALTLELPLPDSPADLTAELPRMVRDALNSLGAALIDVRQPAAAAAAFEDAVQRARADGDAFDEARSLAHLGRALAGLGRTEEALEFQRQAVTLLAGQDRPAQLLTARLLLSRTLRTAGRPEEALAELEAVRTEAGSEARAEVDRAVAKILLALDRPAEAVARLRSALDHHVAAEQVFPAAVTRHELGRALIAAGEPAEAVEVLLPVELAAAMNQDHWLTARAWHDLARAHHALGTPDRPDALLRHAAALARSTGDGQLLVRIGQTWQRFGDLPLAVASWLAAVDALLATGDLTGAHSLLLQVADGLEPRDDHPDLQALIPELRTHAAALAAQQEPT
ncbi:ATP-binding protein [Kitasatospora sp. NPDC096147]|uniref:ATP-binding protein n=1 Tax=Kitasatospora sp. NPDC096147 TaxID=3364093 RepID=UPI0037F7C883